MDILIVIIVGAVAGWLASKVMRLQTNAFLNIIIGVVGSMLGDYLIGMTRLSLGWGILGDVLVAFSGAVLLILAYKLLSK